MKSYGWTPEFVQYGITGAEGWVYYSWARENEASVWGGSEERVGDGYIKQEYKAEFEKLWTTRTKSQ